MVAEWQASQNSVFLLTSKITLIPPHSVIPDHSRMPRNENEERRDFIQRTSHSFSLHSDQFYHSRMSQNDGMRVKWVIFLKQGETLHSEISLILPSFDHSLSISFSSYDHSFHLRIIPNSNLNNPAFLSFSLIRVSFNSRMIEGWQNDDEMRETIIWGLKKKGVLR